MGQAGTGMLAVGLPSPIEDTGIFPATQWWYRFMCDCSDRTLDVQTRRRGSYEGR